MSLKIVLAGLAGGVVLFMWGFVSHMLLPLGEAGLSTLPFQSEVLPAISAKVSKPGLYMFPWPEDPPGTPMPQNEQTMKKADDMYKTMPHGMLLYHPPSPFDMTPKLITEFATNLVSSLIAAALVAMTLGSLDSFAKRMLLVTAVGLSAGIAVNVPHWNWYEFPTRFMLGEVTSHVVGFALVGGVIAAILKPGSASSAAPPAP